MKPTFNHDLLKKEYCETTATLKEIANYHDVNYNTLKSFANRNHWQKHQRITKYLDQQYRPNHYHALNDKQLAFIYLIMYFEHDPFNAYCLVYGCSYEASRVNAYRLLRRADIKAEVSRINQMLVTAQEKPVPYSKGFNYIVCNGYRLASELNFRFIEEQERIKMISSIKRQIFS